MSVNGVTSGAANAYDIYAANQNAAKTSEETNSKGNASDERITALSMSHRKKHPRIR